MVKSSLYSDYRIRVSHAAKPCEFDTIIESAYRDYVTGKLSDDEYGRIYFACVARHNSL